MWVIHVARGDGVTMGGEFIGRVRGDVDFIADGKGEIVKWMGETTTEDVGHGDEDVTDMNPPFTWMDRKPVREEPL